MLKVQLLQIITHSVICILLGDSVSAREHGGLPSHILSGVLVMKQPLDKSPPRA